MTHATYAENSPCAIVARFATEPKTFAEIVTHMMIEIPAPVAYSRRGLARRYAEGLVRPALNTLKQDGRVVREGRKITVLVAEDNVEDYLAALWEKQS